MRPGLEELLRLLRGGSNEFALDVSEWKQVFAVAEEEHILPWTAHLGSAKASVPPEVLTDFRAIEREAAVAAFYWVSELVTILKAFAKSDVMVVPLKGPFLGERLYGDAALRVNYDLDILVPKRDLVRAEAVLSSMGFNPGAPDDYHRQWYRGPTTVELHHDVENPLAFDFDTAGVLGRAQRVPFHGQVCWQLTPGDELVFLCLHGVRHRFERLSLIVDLCLAFERLSVPEPVEIAQQDTDRNKLLMLGLAMAQRLRQETRPLSPVQGSTAQRMHLERLADRLWEELITNRSEPLDWRAVHSFYLEMELPAKRLFRRMRHARILVTRIIDRDYEFAATFGCSRRWQVRLLRPVRLISDVFRKPARVEGEA